MIKTLVSSHLTTLVSSRLTAEFAGRGLLGVDETCAIFYVSIDGDMQATGKDPFKISHNT